jgi:hypothetical protein
LVGLFAVHRIVGPTVSVYALRPGTVWLTDQLVTRCILLG